MAGLVMGAALYAGPGPASATPQARHEAALVCGGTSSGAGTYEPTGPRVAKVRVANFYLNTNGTPGGTLDFYDAQYPAKSDKPLISGLAYGQISGYVSPRAAGPKLENGDYYANLYTFQHGCRNYGGKVDGEESGTPLIETGWAQGQQETLILGDGVNGLQAAPSSIIVNEVEPPHHGQSYVLKPPSGKGMLVANDFGLVEGTAKIPGVELRIDGHCTGSILTGGPPAKPNPADIEAFVYEDTGDFPLSPGAHTVNLVADPAPGTGLTLQTCNAAPARTSTTVKISTKSPVMLFFYGKDPFHAKVLVTTIG